MEDRRQILTQKADKLLVRGRILTQEEQIKLDGILLEIEGMNIKITSPDSDINNQVPRIRRKKTVKNKQLILTF